MKKKIIISENQYRRIFLNEQKTDIENLKNDLLKRGWDMSVISTEGKTAEEALARSVLKALRKLNDLIAEKVISGSKGNYSVCVKKVPGGCNPRGYFYSANDFDDLVNNVADKSINKIKASYVVYNTDLYFNFDKIQNEVLSQFKFNKNAGSSDLFPSGWWTFFVNYFGTDNYKVIKNKILSINPAEISTYKGTLNKYEGSTSVWEYLGDCFTNYHCVLDVASIATLAIPGVGLAVSAGLDFINAASYGVEASNAKTSEERNAALLAGGLTLFGGFLGGGVSQTKRILTKGSRNPKIYNYVDDVMVRVESELPQFKNLPDVVKNKEVAKIYKETADKYGLKNDEILIAHDILKDFSKIDTKIAKEYTNALKLIDSKVGRANLTKIANDSAFKKVVLENNGDVIIALNKYMKTQAGKEALVEAGLFIALGEVMSDPQVQKWIGDSYHYLKYRNRTDIKGLVEKEKFNWEEVKQIFGSNSSVKDNTLLTKAWEKGWRPEENITKSIEWLINNPQYQTDTFKKMLGLNKVQREVVPKDPKQRKEGIIYYDSNEELEMRNSIDDNITPEELETTSNVFDQYI